MLWRPNKREEVQSEQPSNESNTEVQAILNKEKELTEWITHLTGLYHQLQTQKVQQSDLYLKFHRALKLLIISLQTSKEFKELIGTRQHTLSLMLADLEKVYPNLRAVSQELLTAYESLSALGIETQPLKEFHLLGEHHAVLSELVTTKQEMKDQIHEEAQQLKQALHEMQTEFTQTERHYETEIAELTCQLHELTSDMDQLQSELGHAKEEKAQLDKEIAETRQTVEAELAEFKATQQAEVMEWRANEVASLESEKEALQTEIAKLTQELEQTKLASFAYEEELKDRMDKSEQLKAQIAQDKQKHTEMKREYRKEINKLKKTLAEWQAKVAQENDTPENEKQENKNKK